MPYIPHTPEEVREMLDCIGAPSVVALFADIPESLRPAGFDLPPGMTEMEVRGRLEHLAAKNRIDFVSFLGAGFYDHYTPAAVDALTSRGEFYTAYTPYQAEASQGTLQAVFEFQTAVCRLFGMDLANASVYDGGTAIYEALMMAVRHTKRRKALICETVSPIYRTMLATFTEKLGLALTTVPHVDGLTDFAAFSAALDHECAAVVVQNPNFFGSLQDYSELFSLAASRGALSIASVYPVMQSVLATPRSMGADICVAEGQSLGLPLSFGGPYLGIMSCTKELARQMPGRIVGRTNDAQGRVGYVLTLQAREQHIRRQKATSNICSNQALCALRVLIHLCLLGDEGLRRQALHSMERAHYAAERLTAIPGVRRLNDAPFANEFTILVPGSALESCASLAPERFIPGFPLTRYYPGLSQALVVCCTEKHRFEDIDTLAALLGGTK